MTPNVMLVICFLCSEPSSWMFTLTVGFIVVTLVVILCVMLSHLHSGECGDPHTNRLIKGCLNMMSVRSL